MKNIISLTGDIASGKGAVSEILSEKLEYSIYKVSNAIREFCKEKGIDINEFQNYVAQHPEFDRNVEQAMGEYAKANDNYIIEARTGWFMAPFSFKVFLTVDINVAAKRLIDAQRDSDVENYNSIEEAVEYMKTRFSKEKNRWLSLYNKDISDMNNFDLIVDTTDKTPEEVANIIIEEYNKKREE